jgi:hypothetical protein
MVGDDALLMVKSTLPFKAPGQVSGVVLMLSTGVGITVTVTLADADTHAPLPVVKV